MPLPASIPNPNALNWDLNSIRERLSRVIVEKSIKIAPPGQPFLLTSGLKSNYYINGKLTTGDPEGLFCAARLILDAAWKSGAEAVGGPTLGADAMVGAVAALSLVMGYPLSLFIVRKEAKKHGTQDLIEGPAIAGRKVLLVEDVITTGGSVLRAAEAVQAQGGSIIRLIALVDREQGGKEAFEKAGIPYAPIFSISELLPPPILQCRQA
ncbi:MAG: orotate phosphoribosyltransferase [bacterium]